MRYKRNRASVVQLEPPVTDPNTMKLKLKLKAKAVKLKLIGLNGPVKKLKVGEITPEISRFIKRQNGEIFLEEDRVFHIDDEKHKREIEAIGLSIADFVKLVCENFNEIRQGNGRSILLVQNSGKKLVAAVKLVVGDYYTVSTALPMRTKYLTKKKLLWSQDEAPNASKSSLGTAFKCYEPLNEETRTNDVCSHNSSIAKLQILDQYLGMPYIASSQICNSLDVDTPDSMGYEIHLVLKKLKLIVGPVEDYVQNKFGYVVLPCTIRISSKMFRYL